MDLMDVRRELMGVIASMASGVQIIKGSFTAASDSSNNFQINIGKSLSSYIYWIRMKDSSLADLKQSGQTSAKMYECIGKYPAYSAEQIPGDDNCYLSYKINPSTSELSATNAAKVNAISDTSIKFTCQSYNNGANILYRGSEYDYYIIPME